jgi:hypothetical protein
MAIFFTKSIAATGGAGGGPASREFNWRRALLAAAFLVIIFIGGVYCAHDKALEAFSAALVHGFEILLGGLIGMIVGEASTS